MASYKEGHERLSQTGGGMDGIELITFQEWVTTNICKYYFELDAVLKDRPNVKPWYTNEDVSGTEDNDVEEEDSEGNMSISSTNDHESLTYIEQEFNTYDSDTEVETTDISPGTNDIELTHEYETITNNSRPFDLSNHSRTNFSPTSDGNRSITMMSPSNTSSDEYATPTSSTPENKRKGNQLVTRNLSPIEARTMQRNLKKKKNRTIAKKKSKCSSSKFTTMDDEDREIMVETRNARMSFDRERHSDLQLIESQKLTIEKERLQMEKDNLSMRKDHVLAQTSLEKNRIVLLKLEMFKTRQGIKKEYPEVTEEYLNTNFPYPE